MDATVTTTIVTTVGAIIVAGMGLFSTKRWGQAAKRAEVAESGQAHAETENERLRRERGELAAERAALARQQAHHVENLEQENARLRKLLATREEGH